MKGKTDTHGYPFEQINRSLSVRHPFERLKKFVQRVRSVCISVPNTLASVRSIATSIRTVLNPFERFFIRLPTRSVRSENCGIRSNGLTSILFIRSKGEKCTCRFSTVIQYSGQNVAIHIYVTKSWDKRLTQLSF